MFEFEFTKQGYKEATEYLKEIGKYDEVSIRLPEDLVRFANNEFLKNKS